MFHAKVKMISGDRVEGLVGHAPDGVCLFAVAEGVPVYLDESIRRFGCARPACGSSNSTVPRRRRSFRLPCQVPRG